LNRKTIIATIALLVAVVALTAFAGSSAKDCCKDCCTTTQDCCKDCCKDGQGCCASMKQPTSTPGAAAELISQNGAQSATVAVYNIDRKIPLNEPVTVEFTPHRGEFSFACGMDMLKGKLIVE
jgi:hypothetical protein